MSTRFCLKIYRKQNEKETKVKGLNQFQHFDTEGFFRDKRLLVTGVREWTDFNTKEVLGTIVETVIAVDKTPYKTKEGQRISNRFEKLNLKIPVRNFDVELDKTVVPAGEVTATVYGDFRNQLSVKCTEIKIL